MAIDPNTQPPETLPPSNRGGILDFLGGKALIDTIDKGTEILAALTKCTIKPKGTPHRDVWIRTSKFFYMYGDGGIMDEKGFKQVSALFDKSTGRAYELAQLNPEFSIEKRKAYEATVRKKCESPTGSVAYYTEIKPGANFKGYIKLSDNKIYDAAFYSYSGGSYQNPIYLAAKNPVGINQAPLDQNANIPVKAGFGNFAGVALLGYLLTK